MCMNHLQALPTARVLNRCSAWAVCAACALGVLAAKFYLDNYHHAKPKDEDAPSVEFPVRMGLEDDVEDGTSSALRLPRMARDVVN